MARTALRVTDLKKGRIDYNRCALEELQGFVAARGLKHYGKHTHSAARELIIILQRADDNPTFPYFLDLAPELRNRVYDELLVFDAHAGFAYPQILASCRQVNDEAKGIMRYKNVAHVRIDLGILPEYRKLVDYKLSFSGPLARESTKHLHDLLVGPILWPRALWKFENVQVDIRFGYGPVGQLHLGRETLGAVVASLASFLGESLRLKRVTVNGDFDTVLRGKHATAAEISSLLYPISRLYANVDCVFKGFQACPEVPQTLIDTAKAHHDFYQTPFLRKLALVGLELNTFSDKGYPLGDGHDLEQKIAAVEVELLNFCSNPYDNVEDEKKLKECTDRAAILYNEFAKTRIMSTMAAHEEEYGPLHACLACHFQRVYHQRIAECSDEEWKR